MNRDVDAALRELRDQLAMCASNTLDVDTAFSYLQFLLWNTHPVWESSDLRGKQQLQRRVFPKGVSWEEDGFLEPVTHSLYTLLGSDSLTDSLLVAPQGFEPRLIGSEPTVLPLNERAIQVKNWQLQARAGATISRLIECTGEPRTGQPTRTVKVYSSRRTSSGF